MSLRAELVPARSVVLLYRRYLKAAHNVPNATIRHLLTQQIRLNFRRHQSVSSPTAQRELLQQAHSDLMILEDERHSRTLYINKYGMVSCLEWEMRRNELSFTPKANLGYIIFFSLGFSLLAHIALNTKRAERAEPEIAKTVQMMADRLEVDNLEELPILRGKQVERMLDDLTRQRELEARILATFQGAPEDVHDSRSMLPTLLTPTPTRRTERKPTAFNPAP